MSGEIRYRFVASGHDAVLSAFRSIDQQAQRSSYVARDAAERAAGATERAGKRRRKGSEREEEAYVESVVDRHVRGDQQIERSADRRHRVAMRRLREEEQQEARVAKTRRESIKDEGHHEREGKPIALRGVGSVGRLALAGATTAAGLALSTVGAAAREAFALNDISRRLAISARAPGEALVNPMTLQREFESTSLATPGVSAEDVASGVQRFVSKTGDLSTARSMQRTWATITSATGSDYTDIAGTAADLMQKFDIKSVEDMQQAFATLTFQGKKGAFELKDAAACFAEMSAAAQRFGLGSGTKAIAVLGGLAQIARTATGSAAEASTAVQNMFSQLVAKSGKLRSRHGVRVFDEKGAARDVRDVLVDTIGLVGKTDLAKKKEGLQSIFGMRGSRAVSPLITAFSNAALKTQGTEAQKLAAGMAAVRAALADAIDAPGTWADVVDDAAEAQRSSSVQLSAAWDDLKAKTSAEVTPALVALAPKIGGLVSIIDPAISVFATLVDITSDFLDVLKEQGIIKPKKISYAEAGKRISSWEEVLEAKGLDATSDDIRKYQELLQAREAANKREFTPRLRTDMNEDEFMEEFAKRRNPNAFGFGGNAIAEAARGKAIYQDLIKDSRGTRALHENPFMRAIGNDTDEQLALIAEMSEIIARGRAFKAGEGLAEGPNNTPYQDPRVAASMAQLEEAEAMKERLNAASDAVDRFAQTLDRAAPKASIMGAY